MIEDAMTKGELLELLRDIPDETPVFVACHLNDETGYYPISDVTTEIPNDAPLPIEETYDKQGIVLLITEDEVK